MQLRDLRALRAEIDSLRVALEALRLQVCDLEDQAAEGERSRVLSLEEFVAPTGSTSETSDSYTADTVASATYLLFADQSGVRINFLGCSAGQSVFVACHPTGRHAGFAALED